jgi:aldehyde:ferredoxin oxidoreductase
MGKVFKKITKPIQKLIPKEIKPFLPALAAVFGPAAFAGTGIFSSAASFFTSRSTSCYC